MHAIIAIGLGETNLQFCKCSSSLVEIVSSLDHAHQHAKQTDSDILNTDEMATITTGTQH